MVTRAGLLLLLGWGVIAADPEPQVAMDTTQPETLDFGFVPSGVYDTLAYYEPGPIGLLFHMVHAFLHVVQPNAFPGDLVTRIAQQSFGSFQADYQKPENVVLTLQAVYYELGFLVCTALGVLFVLLAPMLGLCFCMCRCCDNCGGEMHQRQRKNADCQRSFIASALFITSLFVTAGVLCAYTANQNLSYQLRGVRRLVNSNMRDLQTFVNQTPAQIQYLIEQYDTAKSKVISDLDNVGPLLGGKIHQQLGLECLPALSAALSMSKAMRETKDALENMNTALEVLQDGSARLQTDLSQVRSSLDDALGDPACSREPAARICGSVSRSLSQLAVDANFTKLPDVSKQLAKVNNVLKTDLSSIIQKGFSSFNDTPNMVKDQTADIVKGVRGLLDGIGTNITNFSKRFPVKAVLNNFTVFISHSHSHIEDFYPEMDQMDFYRWTCCVALCSMVVLVLVFNLLGLLCGICGYDKHASPTTRGCISNTGGNLLMAGTGFTFIFCWVLMGVVTSTFVIGGNMEKLVCEPFGTRQLFKVIDTPYLVSPAWKNFIPGFLYHDPDIDLTTESLYSNCKENKGIYAALQFDNIFNLTAILNVSLYTKDVLKKFEGVKVDLANIVLLESEGRQNLISFANTGVDEINYPAYLAELNKGVTLVDLLSFASNLEAQTDQLPQGALESGLRRQAIQIRQIHNQQVIPMEQSMKYARAKSTLGQSVRALQSITSDLSNKIADILSAIERAQNIISNNATHVINQETEKYRDGIIGYFQQYIDWVKTSLAMDVATCRPFSNIVDSVEIVACGFIVDSVNTFWFGLGCATLFLIPSVILSVRLAKFYRRMDTEDVYDDAIEDWN